MRLRFAFLTICMLLGATVANAQFNANFANFSQQLTMGCGSGEFIPDGTTIQIFWDSLGNGPTPDDRQPVEGPGHGQVNFNQFILNGAQFDYPGGFLTDTQFSMTGMTPDPDDQTGHPLYWLRICLDAQGIYWQSDTVRVLSGNYDYLFGDDEGETHITCVTGTCGGCQSPSPVMNLAATVGGCDSIVVTWNHDMNDIDGYRVLIDGTEPYHFIPNPATPRFVDFTSLGGQDHIYRVRAYRICVNGADIDTAYSTAFEVTGRRVLGPPTPMFMTASDDQCGAVIVRWQVNTVAGLDSFRIYRNDVLIGTINNQNAGTQETFSDNNPGATVNEYCVCGTSLFCQDDEGLATNGPLVCDDGAAGSAPVCTITNVAATTNDCDEICVTFTATCADADSFEIFRNNSRAGAIDNAGGPNFSFCYAAPVGNGDFQVRAKNICGPGTLQPAAPGVRGTRLGPPGQVQGIVASDTLCDLVRVTWTDLPEADSYSIRKQGNEIATVAGDINTYDDLAAVAGQTRTYTVVAISECGAGAVAAGNGGTRPLPNGNTTRATFTMVTAGPPNWTYSMEVETGCISRVKIEDYCAGTTATAPNGWTVTVHGLDSIVYSTTDAVGFSDPAVTGFGLSHPTCDGTGGWTIGGSGGSIRGPLPVGENAEIPTEFGVKVFPNPFNPQTNFRIAIPQASDTRILVFNINGQLVRDMELGRMQAGYHTVQFGGADLPSGMYFARVQSGVFNSTHKLMLLK